MARVLKNAEVNPKPPKWRKADVVYYKNVRMSTRKEEITETHMWGDRTYVSKRKIYILTEQDHNTNYYVNPNGKDFWLIERREEV